MSEKQLLDFPCDFPVKVMGRAGSDFEAVVVGIFRRHFPSMGEGAAQVRGSRNGNFLSVTMVVRAESRKQLDDLYRELTACEQVVMAL